MNGRTSVSAYIVHRNCRNTGIGVKGSKVHNFEIRYSSETIFHPVIRDNGG